MNDYDNVEINRISREFNLTQISSRILLNRNLITYEQIRQFLNPGFEYFEDATNYKDLVKGCNRILDSINKKEKILVYGDYDVDGITSISQFMVLLKKAGANISYYVPERESEGYGISSLFVEKLKNKELDVDLLITVDCGISEVEKINIINNLIKDVIILDHHQCSDKLPNAFAIINPKQKDCPSINKQLCAAGLSFKFLRYLNKFLKVENIEDKLLELACLGTIADIVELIGDNRIITFNGLKLINKSCIVGLKKLIEKSGINDKVIESFHIGYIIAPRINASGRMDTAEIAIRLLLTEDEQEAQILAEELESLNISRKQTEIEIFNEAVNKIETEALFKKNVLVVYGTNWHEGVLGIVASKLTEKYEKPSVVISVKNGIGKGSARSIDFIDIYEAFKSVEKYITKYGGHKLAAGLTIPAENIAQFTNELNKYLDKIISVEDIYKEVKVDAIIECSDVNLKLYDEINKFEPFGHGNPKPVFALRNAELKDIRRVGKSGEHLSFKLSDCNNDIPVIGFSKISILDKILTKPMSYIVTLNSNEYRGNRNLQLVLLDVEEQDEFQYIIDENKNKIINSLINRSKSKIIKTDIFILEQKINKLYNTKTTVEEIICILKKNGSIQYVLKNEVLYIKK